MQTSIHYTAFWIFCYQATSRYCKIIKENSLLWTKCVARLNGTLLLEGWQGFESWRVQTSLQRWQNFFEQTKKNVINKFYKLCRTSWSCWACVRVMSPCTLWWSTCCTGTSRPTSWPAAIWSTSGTERNWTRSQTGDVIVLHQALLALSNNT